MITLLKSFKNKLIKNKFYFYFCCMEFTAEQVAGLLEGKVEGDTDVKVNKLAKIEEGETGALSFLANPKYNEYIYSTDASVVIVNNDLLLEKPVKDTCTLIRVSNAYESFTKLLEIYNQIKNNKQGIEKTILYQQFCCFR